MPECDRPDPATARPPARRPAAQRLYRCCQSATATLTRSDRRVLGQWASAHLGLAVIAWLTAWTDGQRPLYNALLGVYGQWDYAWYQTIAAHGYFSGNSNGPSADVFLPGFPVMLALIHLAVRNWITSGLLVSLAAGGVALVCLGRLGGERAALYLLLAPAGMYLMVGYSESLFLAFALPAWMAAKRKDWPVAALLAALAALVRINGLFLIAGLLIAAATSEPGRRLRATACMALAAGGPGLYELYLWIGTGSWTAWASANSAWDLHFVGPWRSLTDTWNTAFGHALAPDRAAMYQIEILCVFAGVALTLLLLWRRAWPEATYVGLTFIALGTTTYYQAVPRALLISWPLYVLLAQAAKHRPWIGQAYLWTSVPLAVLVAVGFFDGLWAV
jgi:hypothetical protein